MPPTPEISAEAVEKLTGTLLDEFGGLTFHEIKQFSRWHLHQLADKTRAIERLGQVSKQAQSNANNADEHYTILVAKYNAALKERDAARAEVERLKADKHGLNDIVCIHHTDKERHNIQCPICLKAFNNDIPRLICKAAHAEVERDQLTTQLQSAQAAIDVAKAALRNPIQGCTLKYYLNEQFPSTIGHKPFEDFYRTQMDALEHLNNLTSGSELIKQK